MKTPGLICGLALFVSIFYLNHFHNAFQFDDYHTIVNNPYIQDLRNIPLFFRDAATFSMLPANRTYRPLVSASLAVDYALGGLNPAYFHASTFFWFLLQLQLMYALFLRICDTARPDPGNQWIALFAAAVYGVHPAIAETVNYIIQRGDLYSTLGVVAALVCYAYVPGYRKYGLYLVPFIAALLSKPPALVFPALLFIYLWLIEEESLSRSLYRCLPAISVAAVIGYLILAKTPSTFDPGSTSAYAYRITQPLVALRYFRTFFVPNRLVADTDFPPVANVFQDGAWLGFVFVCAVVVAALWSSRRREWRPAAFGLWWFLIAQVPTAVFPLTEVENDHRMFFPFAGLVLAVCWPAGLFITKSPITKWKRVATAAAAAILLCIYGLGTVQRNQVWRTNESLWRDVTVKSPKNGRGLMNYGVALMERGDYAGARSYYDRAAVYIPNYYPLEINRAVVDGVLQDDVAAEQHFNRAIALAPDQAEPHYFFARWLNEKDRWAEAHERLRLAIAANQDYLPARHLRMAGALNRGDWRVAIEEAEATLQRFPYDAATASYRRRALSLSQSAPTR